MFTLDDIFSRSFGLRNELVNLNLNFSMQFQLVFLIAILAAYAAIFSSQKSLYTKSKNYKYLWILLGGGCFSLGIWLMYFVDGLGCGVSCANRYGLSNDFLSIIPGVFVGILIIRVISRHEMSFSNLIISGLLIGVSVSIIYYLNMTAMRSDGVVLFNEKSFLLLIITAILFAMLAIWTNFRLLKLLLPQDNGSWVLLPSALIMSGTMMGVHYMAIATAQFVPNNSLGGYESDMTLVFLMSVILMIACLIFLAKKSSSIFEKRKQYLHKKYYFIIICSIVFWIGISWFGSGYYYHHVQRESYEQEVHLTQQQAQQYATGLNERLQLFKEISLIGAAGELPREILLHHSSDISSADVNANIYRQSLPQDDLFNNLNQHFKKLAKTLKVDAMYLVNATGRCVAASNADTTESFVGINFENKEYFHQAKLSYKGITPVIDSVNKSPGLFFSTPIFYKNKFIGAVIVRRTLDNLREIIQGANVFVTDINGVIILATNKNIEYQSINNSFFTMPAEKRTALYGRNTLQSLKINSWTDKRFPLAVRLGNSNDPVTLSKAVLPQNTGITLRLMRPLRELVRLRLERSWLFAFLTVSGSLAIVAACGLVLYWRKSRKAEIDVRIAATAFESQQGILVTDVNRLILRVNKTFTDMTGYSAADAVGKTPIELFNSGRHGTGFYAEMTQTLKSKGLWQGEMWSKRKNDSIFLEGLTISVVKDEIGATSHYVDTFTDMTNAKKVEDQLQRLSFYDLLTGLPNRRLLFNRLKQAINLKQQNNNSGALLFIDLDNFKAVNDTLGYHYGDILLEQVTKRLIGCVGVNDTLARFGGDEFVVILEDLKGNEHEVAIQAELIGEKILRSANQSYNLGSHKHRTTYSIGIILFSDALGDDDELLKRAELAMFQAKEAGRNTLRFFSTEMQSQMMARMVLEDDLREAVTNNEFILYYQPQVNSDHVLVGVEALIRWAHPLKGMIPPDQFITLAEDTGMIFSMGRWALETACVQLSQWAKQPGKSELTIAVNVSARQFAHKDFVNTVLKILEKTGANPLRLKLELTESALAHDVENIIAKMTILKATGLSFSLDDFGTGYSSLAYLKKLPLDQLKIDQGFVRNILLDSNDAAIAKMVVVLAERLGLSVIAEGVETIAQKEFLEQEGCYSYQGYLFSRPLPAHELDSYMANFSTVA